MLLWLCRPCQRLGSPLFVQPGLLTTRTVAEHSHQGCISRHPDLVSPTLFRSVCVRRWSHMSDVSSWHLRLVNYLIGTPHPSYLSAMLRQYFFDGALISQAAKITICGMVRACQ